LGKSIDENSGALDFDLAISVAEYFRLTVKDAQSIQSQVFQSVRQWEKTAKKIGISPSEIDIMQPAFRV
jgi:serine/threonine-protein kinase HipA